MQAFPTILPATIAPPPHMGRECMDPFSYFSDSGRQMMPATWPTTPPLEMPTPCEIPSKLVDPMPYTPPTPLTANIYAHPPTPTTPPPYYQHFTYPPSTPHLPYFFSQHQSLPHTVAGVTKSRKRTRTTPEQLAILQEIFAANPSPNTQLRLHIARHLDLPPRSVQIWFQNKRAKMKQLHKKSRKMQSLSDMGISGSGEEGLEEFEEEGRRSSCPSTPSVAQQDTDKTDISAHGDEENESVPNKSSTEQALNVDANGQNSSGQFESVRARRAASMPSKPLLLPKPEPPMWNDWFLDQTQWSVPSSPDAPQENNMGMVFGIEQW
ncbi:uncharacterized protein VTP21DRAFT_7054 [Calcarisporiella thermophila]|uniref:uncharacterized protein n=1 Tax=Calcarisporiella thermophila TaxID=911321 RepID=UPI0037425741